ncbi:unnamed protein product [marine sediment metagenome]|uniref:Uncharacterized protein n=1 Tax=marine sediment metagenome TaxID=412755 RepID=X1D309_9ZZZZ
MKWLTLIEIGRRARSKRGALKVSYEHWCQLYDATAKELRAKHKETNSYIADDLYCGLCRYYRHECTICIFHLFCPYGLWDIAYDALEDWINGRGDWHAWKRASKAVRDKLKELIEQGT